MLFRLRNFTDYLKCMVLTCFVGIFFILIGCSSELEYDEWKDSHKAFGNGEYQLMHSITPEYEPILSLHNCKYNTEILYNVPDYKVVDSVVYFYGYCPVYTFEDHELFVILYIENNTFSAYYERTADSDQMASALEQRWKNNVAEELVMLDSLDTCDESVKEIFTSLKLAS